MFSYSRLAREIPKVKSHSAEGEKKVSHIVIRRNMSIAIDKTELSKNH